MPNINPPGSAQVAYHPMPGIAVFGSTIFPPLSSTFDSSRFTTGTVTTDRGFPSPNVKSLISPIPPSIPGSSDPQLEFDSTQKVMASFQSANRKHFQRTDEILLDFQPINQSKRVSCVFS